jgi:AcrR family transcriptional regulator
MRDNDRPLRADARRNRARVLEVAQQVFETEGLAVPVDEVAKRAGVGVGTVYRHFPTKEALFEAIMLSRVEQLTAEARALADAADPGKAFFDFFEAMVTRVVLNKALGEALTAAGYDLILITSTAGQELRAAQEVLLTRAQAAGAVRADLSGDDYKAILVGVITMERQAGGEPGRLAKIMVESLRAH